MDSRGGVLRSYARLPLIPPTSFSHKGRRGSWGVLKPTTSEGTRGLPKRLPVREIEHGSRFSQRLNPMDETTPRAPSLRVLGVSACIRPAHAEARRRGDTYIVSVKGRPVACHPCSSVGYSSTHAGETPALPGFRHAGETPALPGFRHAGETPALPGSRRSARADGDAEALGYARRSPPARAGAE